LGGEKVFFPPFYQTTPVQDEKVLSDRKKKGKPGCCGGKIIFAKRKGEGNAKTGNSLERGKRKEGSDGIKRGRTFSSLNEGRGVSAIEKGRERADEEKKGGGNLIPATRRGKEGRLLTLLFYQVWL